MKTINALALINDIIEEINENGFQPDMVVTQLKELRGHALEEKNPVATKALRLAYEHIALHQEFAIQYMGEEDEDEEDEAEEEAVKEENETAPTEGEDAPKEEGEATTTEGDDIPKEETEVEEEPEPEDDNFGYFLELIRAAENRFNRAELLDIIKMLQEYE